MSKFNKTKIFLGTVVALPFAMSSVAQAVEKNVSAEKHDTSEIEVIRVTAEKRVSTLQETPIAITALNANELAKQGIEEANDIQFAIPNAMYTDRGQFNIRGVGNNAISASSESGTGVHVNGIYLTAPSGQNEYYDLQTIEILRGPQGTLYGRNTTAGVVNMITQRPTDYLEGNLSVEYGNFNSIRTVGALNLPISDSIKQRFAFNTVKRDGFTENIATGNDIDGRNQYSIRSTTQFDISENFDATLFAQYFKEDSNRSNRRGVRCIADAKLGCSADKLGHEFVNSDFTDGNAKNLLALIGVNGSLLQRPDFYNFNPDGSRKINPDDPRKVNIDNEPTLLSDDLMISLEMNYDFDNGILTSVTGYHERSNEGQRDFDNANGSNAYRVPVNYAFNDTTFLKNTLNFEPVQLFDVASEQYSQEVRFVSTLDGDINYTIGLYYLTYDTDSRVSTYFPTLSLISQALRLPAEYHDFDTRTPSAKTTSWAGFGEVYYDITDKLKLTTGLRYSDEDKSQETQTVTPFNFRTPGFDPTKFEYLENDWQETTGKIGISYDADFEATHESLLFATISRGYKAGGLNPGGASKKAFDPEYINSFEFGMKNTMADKTLQANATFFYYDYTGLQLGSLEQSTIGAAITDNTDAEVKGAEFEFIAIPLPDLLVNLNIALLDSKVTGDFSTPDVSKPSNTGFVDVKGNALPYAPEQSVQFGIQYTHPVSDSWEITYRAQTYWQDSFYARVYNTETDKIDSWQQSDATITLRDVNGQWSFDLFMKNMADDDAVTGLTVENTLAGRFRLPVVLDPRQYGLRVNYRFE